MRRGGAHVAPRAPVRCHSTAHSQRALHPSMRLPVPRIATIAEGQGRSPCARRQSQKRRMSWRCDIENQQYLRCDRSSMSSCLARDIAPRSHRRARLRAACRGSFLYLVRMRNTKVSCMGAPNASSVRSHASIGRQPICGVDPRRCRSRAVRQPFCRRLHRFQSARTC